MQSRHSLRAVGDVVMHRRRLHPPTSVITPRIAAAAADWNARIKLRLLTAYYRRLEDHYYKIANFVDAKYVLNQIITPSIAYPKVSLKCTCYFLFTLNFVKFELTYHILSNNFRVKA